MTAKAKQSIAGVSWIVIGLISLISVLVVNFTNISSSIVVAPTAFPEQIQSTGTGTPLMNNRMMSPKIQMQSDSKTDLELLEFKLNPRYELSYQLYQSKVFSIKKRPDKAFKKFIEDLGLSLDENGDIIDGYKQIVTKEMVECQVMGFFPNKPYIKPNC